VSILRNQRGLSLIEATIMLAVVSLLTAVMAPAVRTYVQSAQESAAMHDVEAIATGLSRMLSDTGESWFLRDGNGTLATDVPSHATANRVDLMVSDGNIPQLYSGVTRSTVGTEWTAPVDNAAVQELEYYLATNVPSNASANAYRSATNMSVTANFDPTSGQTFNSDQAWRGPYLPGPLGPDPWGNRYAVNVEFLAKAPGAGPTGNVNDAIVLSAGNNGMIETRIDVDGSNSANDVVFIVSGTTR
jgi:type II secretory pathway pseudopilin PulG